MPFRRIRRAWAASPRIIMCLSLAVLLCADCRAAQSPVAQAGADAYLTDNDDDGGESVLLDGSASHDDGQIVSYQWSEGGQVIATGATPTVWLDIRLHEITLTVTDDEGLSASDTVAVRVFAAPLPVPLDISGGFNMDAWCGPLEFQGLYTSAALTGTSLDLGELQGGLAEGVGWGIAGGGYLMVCCDTLDGFGLPYSIETNWFHPMWLAPYAGTPEDGVVLGAGGRNYHLPSLLGNATYPGDWLETDQPYPDFGIAFNAMTAGSLHRTEDWQIASVTAELPDDQKRSYSDINFVLAARDGADRARNMRIVALYGPDGTDEQVLYAFSELDGGSGPMVLDLDGGDDFEIVYTFSKIYGKDAGPTGAISSVSGSLYEFAVPPALDSDKTLWGIRIEDVAPSLQNNARGLTLFAASATSTTTTGSNLSPVAEAGIDITVADNDNDSVETVTLDGSASSDPDGQVVVYTWSEAGSPLATGASPQVTLGVGVHELTLTVTDNEGGTDTDVVTVTVEPSPGYHHYYVDYESGDDANNGLSKLSPWKHCPGDRNAGAIAAATDLAFGDTVHFKGASVYRGEIVCRSGDASARIVYDGNSAGDWGEGRAIIDGSRAITGWTPCATAEEADGNPNYANIYWAWAPAGVTAFNASFYEDGGLLHPAQDPNIGDPFYPDDVSEYLTFDSNTIASLVDADYFVQADPAYWSGSTYVYLHAGNNTVYRRAVTGYDPAAHELQYDVLDTSYYGGYAMVNSLKILDVPGEMVVREDQLDGQGRAKIYLWPLAGTIDTQLVSATVEDGCFNVAACSYVTIRGFVLRYTGDYKAAVYNSLNLWGTDVTIDDNVVVNHAGSGIGIDAVTNCVVSNNEVRFCKGRGIILTDVYDSSIRYNTLHKNGGTGIDYYGAYHSEIVGNVVTDHGGGHANGITCYLGCNDILIYGNRVSGGSIACTMRDSTDITVAYNILDGNGAYYALADWTNMDGIYLYNNLMLNGGTTISSSSTRIVAKNNIMDGSGVAYRGGVSENNIYTSLSWTQDTLGPGEFEATLDELFVDAADGDYRPRPGSPAIDAGVMIPGLAVSTDIAGTPVPQGTAVDVGPYEYVGGLPGDANGDGAVDIQDFVILKQNYGTPAGATVDQGDFNGDGAVDIQDFVILKQNYGS